MPTVETITYDNPKMDADGNPVKDAAGNPVTEKATTKEQIIAMGPVASQEAIKQLGTNGGGFFNANSAHPYENPTPFSNFLADDRDVPDSCSAVLHLRQHGGRYAPGLGDPRGHDHHCSSASSPWLNMPSSSGNPAFTALGVDQNASATQSGGNMEGKETRFGIVNSALFATITTGASCGAVNSMHDSFTPLGGLVPMAQIQLGEVIFGGVGSGLYGMLVFAVIAVFLAGLMIGRTPEYLGKKIEAFDIKMASLVILIPPMIILGGTALAVHAGCGQGGRGQSGCPWLQRDPVCVLVGCRQQRQRLRRFVRQHAVL